MGTDVWGQMCGDRCDNNEIDYTGFNEVTGL